MYEYEPIIRKINPDIVDSCVDYLKTHNMANRGRFDGSKQNQLIGLIGELDTHYLLKDEYQDLKIKTNDFDGGVDIVHNKDTYDVKTMARTVYTKIDFVNNFANCSSATAIRFILLCVSCSNLFITLLFIHNYVHT